MYNNVDKVYSELDSAIASILEDTNPEHLKEVISYLKEFILEADNIMNANKNYGKLTIVKKE